MNIEQLKFPIGEFIPPQEVDLKLIQKSLTTLEVFPQQLEQLVQNFNPRHWNTPYREGGWTAAQVVHHLADSHMNSYIRFKLAALEDSPTIKAYEEKDWAKQVDATDINVSNSIAILKGVHPRLVRFLQHLDDAAYRRSYFHPEMNAYVPIYQAIPMYAWHSKHHLGHLQLIVK